MEIKNKKRLVLEIALVAVILYLWQKRCKKTSIAEAKAGADVAPTTEATSTPSTPSTPSKTGECGSVSSDCMGTDTSKLSQLGKTVTIDESTANFSGGKIKGVKAQYFR